MSYIKLVAGFTFQAKALSSLSEASNSTKAFLAVAARKAFVELEASDKLDLFDEVEAKIQLSLLFFFPWTSEKPNSPIQEFWSLKNKGLTRDSMDHIEKVEYSKMLW